jgi:hypothetical protein
MTMLLSLTIRIVILPVACTREENVIEAVQLWLQAQNGGGFRRVAKLSKTRGAETTLSCERSGSETNSQKTVPS